VVEFYAGSTLIGSSTTKPYGFVWNNVLPGSYSLTARAVDSTGAATVSAARHVMVESGMAADGVYFIEVDHLNTPRLISDQAGTTVWRWENSDPFGNNPPEEDPDGDGRRFEFNLRFPGQYYDSETGLHYNFFRDYDPGLGRYTTSDPIGLAGGVNTYTYVDGNPISRTDPLGLQYQGFPSTSPVYMVPNPAFRNLLNTMGDDPGRGNDLTPGNWPGINGPWTMPPLYSYCKKCRRPDDPSDTGTMCLGRTPPRDSPNLTPINGASPCVCEEWGIMVVAK